MWNFGFLDFLRFWGFFGIFVDFLGFLACSRKDLPLLLPINGEGPSGQWDVGRWWGPFPQVGEVVGIFGLFKEGLALALAHQQGSPYWSTGCGEPVGTVPPEEELRGGGG